MRVPTTGLPLDERRIIRDGYALARRLMADYQDPPSGISALWRDIRQTAQDLYRRLARG